MKKSTLTMLFLYVVGFLLLVTGASSEALVCAVGGLVIAVLEP